MDRASSRVPTAGGKRTHACPGDSGGAIITSGNNLARVTLATNNAACNTNAHGSNWIAYSVAGQRPAIFDQMSQWCPATQPTLRAPATIDATVDTLDLTTTFTTSVTLSIDFLPADTAAECELLNPRTSSVPGSGQKAGNNGQFAITDPTPAKQGCYWAVTADGISGQPVFVVGSGRVFKENRC